MLKLIDAHAHITRGIPLGRVLDHMDHAGVSRSVVMARETDETRILEMSRRYPGRIVSCAGGRFFQRALQAGAYRSRKNGVRHYHGFDPKWWRVHGDRLFLDLEQRLASGRFHGIGEIRLKHRGYGPGVPEMKCDYDFEMDAPILLRLLDAATRHALAVTVHLEIDTDRKHRLKTFSRALALRPRAKVVWAHGGPCDAKDMHSMLGQHKNLFSEIQPLIRNTYAHKVPYLKTFPRLMDSRGRLLGEWRRLFEGRADRFVVGSDCRTSSEYKHLKTRMDDMRLILSQLPGRAARLIARENAAALFSC